MKQLTTQEKQEIAQSAKENFDGDVALASAAHVHGVGVVKKVGSQIVDWFEKEAIQKIETQVVKYIANKAKRAKK